MWGTGCQPVGRLSIGQLTSWVLQQPQGIDRANPRVPLGNTGNAIHGCEPTRTSRSLVLDGEGGRASFGLTPSKCVLPLLGALTGCGCSAARHAERQSGRRRKAQPGRHRKRALLREQRARLLALTNRRRGIARGRSSVRGHRLGQHGAVVSAIAAATRR